MPFGHLRFLGVFAHLLKARASRAFLIAFGCFWRFLLLRFGVSGSQTFRMRTKAAERLNPPETRTRNLRHKAPDNVGTGLSNLGSLLGFLL